MPSNLEIDIVYLAPDVECTPHVSDSDLERYYRGIALKRENAGIEAHLRRCAECAERLEGTARFVRAWRRASVRGDFDQELE